MAEEWLLRVTFSARGVRKYHHAIQVSGLLRTSLGNEFTISAAKVHIYVRAETAERAREAEQVALQAIAELGLSEDCRLERWDSTSREWRDARSGLPTAQKTEPPSLGAVAGNVANALAGAVVESFLEGH